MKRAREFIFIFIKALEKNIWTDHNFKFVTLLVFFKNQVIRSMLIWP